MTQPPRPPRARLAPWLALVFGLFAPFLHPTAAGANQWIGTVSTDWYDGANWSLGHAPTNGETAQISAGIVNASSPSCAMLQLDGGTLSVSGGIYAAMTTVAPGAILNLVESDHILAGTLINHGHVVWAGGSVQGDIYNSITGHIVNETDGQWEAQGNGSLGTQLTFTNHGLFIKSGDSNTSIYGPGINDGSMEVHAGLLLLNMPFVCAGTIQADAGATVFCFGLQFEPGSLCTGDGTILLEDNTSGVVTGRVQFGYSLRGDLTLAPSSVVTIANDLTLSGTLTNHGRVVWSGGSIRGDIYNSITGHIVNETDGQWEAQGNGSLGTQLTFANHGLFNKSAGLVTEIAALYTTDGTTRVQTGALAFVYPVQQTAGTIELAGGSFLFSDPEGLYLFSGEIRGFGLIVGNVSAEHGSIHPGPLPGSVLNIDGNLRLNPGATLAISAFSALQFDRLVVSGSASLDGSLVFTLANGFVPADHDHFVILTSGSAKGSFAALTTPSQPAGAVYAPSYTSGGVGLDVLLPGFAAWKRLHFGDETDPAIVGDNADPDHDGIANFLEYALGLDPLLGSGAGLPLQAITTDPGDGLRHLTLTFSFPATIADVDYVPEVSADLAGWKSGAPFVTIASDTTAKGVRTVVARDAAAVEASSRRFMRLKVAARP